MSTLTAGTTRPIASRHPGYRAALTGAGLGVVGAIAEALLGALGSTPSGTAHYQHASQYWFTATAFPIALATALTLFGVRAVQRGRDGRLGVVGVTLSAISLLLLSVLCEASVAVGHDIQGGPSYILGTLGAVVGIALFAAGSWRAGLLPRWLLAVWPVVWAIGSFAAVSASPLLLAAFYVVLIALLHKRTSR